MARNEQTRNTYPTDTTTNIVSREHGLPEKLLAAPDFDRRLRFGRAARRDEPNFVASEEVYFFGFVVSEQVVQHLFTF